MALIIDPPSGWKYGFPKPIPEDRRKDNLVWLVEQGYPQKLIDDLGEHFYCRYWEEPDEKNRIMTPVEKASQLVESMRSKSSKLSDFSRIEWPTAKLHALTAVDEVLYYSKAHGFIGLTEWYEEVKQEIEKL